MFKIHKPQLSGSIHSGHFMVSRLDEDDEDNNLPADDSSESERDNANSVEIDVDNPDSVVDANNQLDMSYQVESPSGKNEQLTSWNDLDRPTKQSQTQKQYLTYYTNSYSEDGGHSIGRISTSSISTSQIANGPTLVNPVSVVDGAVPSTPINSMIDQANKELIATGPTSRLGHHNLRGSQNVSVKSHRHHHHKRHYHGQNHRHHQHVTIDTSLTRLLECMSLYYSSKLTSPKWKSFKGLKLRLKCKIRLNNLIWRAWFLQYIRGRKPPGCQFTAPVETDIHKKSETIVLEGKYWKRKEKAIVDEYKKWRSFHKQKSQLHCFRPSSFDWDSRVSNLSSSSVSGNEYHFYPDYDMNIVYNLEDLPPMLEEFDQREPDCYYPPTQSSSMRMVDQQQQAQQQQQNIHDLSQLQKPEHSSRQQQLSQQQNPFQHQMSQAQLHVTTSNNSQQPIFLKRETPAAMTGSQQQQPIQHQQSFNHSHHLQHQQQQQQHHQQQQQQQLQQQQQHDQQQLTHQLHLQRQPILSQFTFDENAICSQQQPQQQTNQDPQSFGQAQLTQPNSPSTPLQQSGSVVSIGGDLYPMSSGSSGCRDEQRRVCHINAEQKRRCNIKNGFDTLKSILPYINQNVNVKISKASMLQKAALYISTLSNEQKQQAEEVNLLKSQIECLKQSISTYQSQLPTAGGPVGCQETRKAREMLQDYVRRRTLENWKFWIFSLLIEPLFESYSTTVSTTNLEEACKTIYTWLDRSCGLVTLRKDVLDSLTFLSTSTNILNTPQTLPTEAVDAVRYQPSSNNNVPQNLQVGGSSSTSTRPSQHPLQASHLAPPPLPPISTQAAAQAMPQLQQLQQHQQLQQQQQHQQLLQSQQPPSGMSTHAIRHLWG